MIGKPGSAFRGTSVANPKQQARPRYMNAQASAPMQGQGKQ